MIFSTFLIFATLNFNAYNSPSIGNLQVFPSDNPWNWDISKYEIHPNSTAYINSVGANTSLHPDFGTVWNGAPNGIPYVVVSNATPMTTINFTDYGDESDPGPYRIPLDAPIEGGSSSNGDRHVIAIDTSSAILYELYRGFSTSTLWNAASGAVFNLTINDHHPLTWTSADAAGLPIFPGLVRYEEVILKKEINHAIRMTVAQSQKAFIFPARHYASNSTDVNRPPMGLRFRLKASYDISTFSPSIQVILRAMKKHGLIVADNGSNWYISGAPDMQWSDDTLSQLSRVKGSNFEAVKTIDEQGNPIYPSSNKINITTHNLTNNNTMPHFKYDIYGRHLANGKITAAGIIIYNNQSNIQLKLTSRM